jgi:8-oxo-dGTP pyrophosphatase MutT (NUDIX family)
MKTKTHPPRVLLQLRNNTGLHDGKFGFPGGKRNNNEPWLGAAMRELYEETGLMVERSNLRKLRRHGGKGQDGTEWRGTFYLAEYWYGKLQLREPKKHNKIEWYSVYNLPKNIVPSVRKVLADLKNYIAFSNFGKAKRRS